MFSTRVSLVAICLLQFAAPASSLHVRSNIDDAELIAKALDINADAIFPPHQAQKRGLLGDVLNGVGNLVNTLLGGAATTTTTTTAATPATTTSANNNNGGATTAQAATTTTANGSNSGNGSGSGGSGSGSDTTSANGSAGTTAANNQGGNNGNQANTGVAAPASGSASASAGGNSANGGSISTLNAMYTGTGLSIVTDENGHTIVATGPVTFEYLTTLPNGIVSTVTEVVTPSADVHSNPSNPHASAPKIAAIAGSIVALFLIIFIVSLLLLMLRKRRRSVQLANSRRDSSLSFGSTDLLHDARRDSRAPLAPLDSVTSFRTAPAYIDGETMEFPLPPVPSAGMNHAEMESSSHRPVSMTSDATFDLAERRSRTSIIADRNFYRKIGQYPAAGTYTPFALAPSSDFEHSEEAFMVGRLSPTELSAALERTTSVKNRRSNNLNESPSVSENPFRDSVNVNVTHPAPPAPALTASQNILTNPNARQSTLWRKTTFGSSHQLSKETHPPSSFTEPQTGTFGRKSSLNSERGTVRSQDMSEYETATETQSQHTSGSGRYSYHSAFARYAGEQGGENPFADTNASESRPSSSRLLTSPVGWRPTTAISGTSSGSNVDRDRGSTPDPKELFYHPPSTGQSLRPDTGSSQAPRFLTAQNAKPERTSQESRSDGEKTIRQTTIAYPSLGGVVQSPQGGI